MVIDAAWPGPDDRIGADLPGADAVVTTRRNLALGVLVADCIPVLLADADARVGAVAHVGRRGLVSGVLQATVAAMVDCGARPSAVVAVVGPGICGACYEVPMEMRAEVASVVPGTAATTRTGTPRSTCRPGPPRSCAAVGSRTVRPTGVCTFEDPRFYSYRRDGVTGRFAGVVVLTSAGPAVTHRGAARAEIAANLAALSGTGGTRVRTAGRDPREITVIADHQDLPGQRRRACSPSSA